jgi:hypothetical protein
MCSWLSGKLLRTSSAVSAAGCDEVRGSNPVVIGFIPFLSAIVAPNWMSAGRIIASRTGVVPSLKERVTGEGTISVSRKTDWLSYFR